MCIVHNINCYSENITEMQIFTYNVVYILYKLYHILRLLKCLNYMNDKLKI